MISVKDCEKIILPDTAVSASSTECTGLMPTPPENAEEEASYKALYSTSLPKASQTAKSQTHRDRQKRL